MLHKLKNIFFAKPSSVKLPLPTPEFLFSGCHAILHNTNSSPGIQVVKSKIPNAGSGVIVTDKLIKAGSIVSLYSGVYFPPPPTWSLASPDGENAIKFPTDFRTLPGGQKVEEPEAYTIHCKNFGGNIDGIYFTTEINEGRLKPLNDNTCGHLVNHPPKGIMPNVKSHTFCWRDYMEHFSTSVSDRGSARDVSSGPEKANEEKYREELDLIKRVNPMGEGVWYFDPWTGDAVDLFPDCAPSVGIAAIATRDILEGEELYMDYKFHPNNRPSWYTPVNYEQQQR